MRNKILFVLLLQLIIVQWTFAAAPKNQTPDRVRIGVDIRLGLQSCIDFWSPITEYLSKTIPEHRFVIVPLASQRDIVTTLENGGIDFLALDPAMGLLAEDRFGAVPLATMIETAQGETTFPSSDAACAGAIIRRADRSDIKTIRDLRGQRVSAVKPWSLTGWIAQWGLFTRDHIDPQEDLKQVVFEGTHTKVVESILNGTTDAGIVDANILLLMGKNKRIPPNSLYVFNREGTAVPLMPGQFAASTETYPGWLFMKVPAASDELAKPVLEALLKKTQDTKLDGMPCQISWTVPRNYNKVRRLLQSLMGPLFAESAGYPLPSQYPAWFHAALSVIMVLACIAILFMLMRNRYARRVDILEDQLETSRNELVEVRAERQRINAILALANCGIDIVDDENRIVYADSNLERQYGDWRGRTCHEYFCDSDTPCPGCQRPGPMDEQRQTIVDFECPAWVPSNDPHAKIHHIEGESARMVGIPFRDEGGRWLYARIHFPVGAFSPKT